MIKSLLAALGLLLATLSPAFSQSSPVKYFSTASNNSTLVLKTPTGVAAKIILKTGIVTNSTTAIYYLKLYDKATAPTCGTDTPKWTLPIPFGAGNSGGGFVLPLGDGLQFLLGLGFCITAGQADNDNTAAATGIVVNLGVANR